jgi:phage terminase small subunit
VKGRRGRTGALTSRERLFCHLYVKGDEQQRHNATAAARGAGYRNGPGLGSQASRLLKKGKVATLVAQLEKTALAKVDSKRDEVLAELHHVGLARLSRCIRIEADGSLKVKPVEEWSESERVALTEANMEAIFEGRGEERTHVGNLVKLKMASKLGALQTLAEHHGIIKKDADTLSFRLEDLIVAARMRRELKKREEGGGEE